MQPYYWFGFYLVWFLSGSVSSDFQVLVLVLIFGLVLLIPTRYYPKKKFPQIAAENTHSNIIHTLKLNSPTRLFIWRENHLNLTPNPNSPISNHY